MSPTQCRMARAALGWGTRDLAEKAAASPDTVARLERGEELKPETVQRFREQFESAGIMFLEADKIAGEGARFAKPPKAAKGRKGRA